MKKDWSKDNVQVFCNRTPAELRAYKQCWTSHQWLSLTIITTFSFLYRQAAELSKISDLPKQKLETFFFHDWKFRNPSHHQTASKMFLSYFPKVTIIRLPCRGFCVWQSRCLDALDGLDLLGSSVKGSLTTHFTMIEIEPFLKIYLSQIRSTFFRRGQEAEEREKFLIDSDFTPFGLFHRGEWWSDQGVDIKTLSNH